VSLIPEVHSLCEQEVGSAVQRFRQLRFLLVERKRDVGAGGAPPRLGSASAVIELRTLRSSAPAFRKAARPSTESPDDPEKALQPY
jgi:hypothetical protein